jgi:hypothetical protein
MSAARRGLQGTYTARGPAARRTPQYLNGVNVGDPAAVGAAGFYYDFDAFDEIGLGRRATSRCRPPACS